MSCIEENEDLGRKSGILLFGMILLIAVIGATRDIAEHHADESLNNAETELIANADVEYEFYETDPSSASVEMEEIVVEETEQDIVSEAAVEKAETVLETAEEAIIPEIEEVVEAKVQEVEIEVDTVAEDIAEEIVLEEVETVAEVVEEVIPEEVAIADAIGEEIVPEAEAKVEEIEMVAEIVEEAVVEEVQEKDSFNSKLIEDVYKMKTHQTAFTTPTPPAVGDKPMCQLKQLGLQFLCDPLWPVISSASGVDRIVIERDPLITMGITKLDKKHRFLSQLNKIFFEKTGLYKDGFRTENVVFAGHKAVLVKALSTFSDSAQIRDYFYIYDGATVHISFMLPETEWSKEDSKKLQEITQGFKKL